jgi:AbiV family abortive infection protein
MIRVMAQDPTPADIRRLLAATLKNVRDLEFDARLLYDAGRFARAVSLAVLCVEEFAKALALSGGLAVAQKGGEVPWSAMLRELSRHHVKLSSHIVAIRAITKDHAPESLNRLNAIFESLGGDDKSAKAFNQVKLRGLYADFDDGVVSCPMTATIPIRAAGFLQIAGGIIGIIDSANWDVAGAGPAEK